MEVADMMLLIVKEFISDEDTLIYSKQGSVPSSPDPESEAMEKGDLVEELAMTKKNLQIIFDTPVMSQRIIALADDESERVTHLFENSDSSVKGLVKMLIDETQPGIAVRLGEVLDEFNEKMPYSVIDDFRKAVKSSMMKRQELLKRYVSN